jgi:hypothetical protein
MTKLSSLLLPFLLAACGGNVVVDGSSSPTSGAGGSTTTGAGGAVGTSVGAGTSFGPTGVGGSQTVTTVSTTTAGVGGSTTANCGGGTFFQMVIDDEPALSLLSSCFDADIGAPALPVPFGQETLGGASSNPGEFDLEGCVSSATNSPGIVVSASGAVAPGTYMVGGSELFTAQGTTDLFGTLTLDQVGPVGGTITGSFEVGQGPLMVQGKFAVCRAHDIDVP